MKVIQHKSSIETWHKKNYAYVMELYSKFIELSQFYKLSIHNTIDYDKFKRYVYNNSVKR